MKKVLLVDHTSELLRLIQQEVDLLKKLEHEHILGFVEASIEGSHMCIYTEYCPNGDMGLYIKMYQGTAMKESRLLLWIRQITEALQYIHGHDQTIIHRDLKPDNIFLDENWNTKLGDFGLARILKTQSSLAYSQCGTPSYMSPEIWARMPYTEKTDIYSLGIMMYEMCHMNKQYNLPKLIYYMNRDKTLLPLPPGYNGGINDLLRSMMSYSPSYRPSATEIFGHDVFKTTQASPQCYALKKVEIIDRSPNSVELIQKEVVLMKTLKHEHILRFVEASIQGSYLCIYNEYCPNGDMGIYIQKNKGTAMEESRLLLWIRQITEALQYLHEHDPKIIHRDLKPDNIFLDENWNTKLGDFGIARILETQTSLALTQCGTQPYMSPEIVASMRYTEKADIWSLGMMMYEMCHMNKKMNLPELIYMKNDDQKLLSLPPGYNGGINELLRSMMSYDPNNRPSATEILGNDLLETMEAPPQCVKGTHSELERQADNFAAGISDEVAPMDVH